MHTHACMHIYIRVSKYIHQKVNRLSPGGTILKCISVILFSIFSKMYLYYFLTKKFEYISLDFLKYNGNV